MDVKSMAKSKRSHTQHNQPKPRKPHQNPSKPTSSISNPNSKIKFGHQKPSLPSNWDRYYDNLEEELELQLPDGVSRDSKLKKAVQEVKLKSKGADFSYLIAQAKESNQHYYSPSFGDSVDDFYQGLAPMLDVKSEGIPSWYIDDDFLLENEAPTNEKAPNFSLDLKALAEELAKADLAKRLFIEPDLLPLELHGQDTNKVDNQMPEKLLQTFETFEELYSIYLADEKIAATEEANKENIIISSNVVNYSKPGDPPMSIQMTENVSERSLDDAELSNSHATLMSQQGTSMLNVKGKSLANQAPLPHSRDGSRPAQFTSSLDDDLDNLLDASNLNKKGSLLPPIEVQTGPTDNFAARGASLQHFQDPFKPSFPVPSCSLDDELDNLLEETSKLTVVKTDSPDFLSSSSSSTLNPGSQPKVLDDFDSWMDTL